MEKDLFLNENDISSLEHIVLDCLNEACGASCYDYVVLYSSLLVKLEYFKMENLYTKD